MDVTTIFANLLDNAIEAGENKKNFWIKIRGEQIQDFTVVKYGIPILKSTPRDAQENRGMKELAWKMCAIQ